MSKTIILVENLSKRYRIGIKEKKSDTLIGRIGNVIKAPFTNFKQLRSLSNFREDSEGVFWALNDINFEVKEGEVLGIIGHNGAGKSTLLKILSRITEPTTGKIILDGRIAALLEVGTGFHQDLSGRENIYMNGTILGMTRKEIDRKLEEIIDFSGVEKHIDTPVKYYSSGMKVRLGFAVAAHLEPEILIIDEVLAVGDVEFQKKCIGKMESVSSSGRTVLFVSHNLSAVKSLCTRSLVMQSGKIIFDGDTQEGVTKYLETYKKTELEDGIIPDSYSTISTGEAKLKRIELLNELNQPTSTVQLYEPLRLSLELAAYQKLNNVMIDVKVLSVDGIEISHSMNLYDNVSFHLEVNRYLLLIQLDNKLQPGVYYFTIGIHHSTGSTIDYVEAINEFEVEMNFEGKNTVLRREILHGYVQASAKWILQ